MYQTALETHLPYPLLALMVLALFYGIHFTKQLRQKCRGIQTRQIGRRKEKTVHTVEMLMQGAALAIVPAQLVSIAWDWSCLPANARFTGFCIGLLGDGSFPCSVCGTAGGRASRIRIRPGWSPPASTASAATRHFSALTVCTSACCCYTVTR